LGEDVALRPDTSEPASHTAEQDLPKLAEVALHRYEMLAAHSRDIILFMRRDNGRILEANTAAIIAYGYNREALLALTIHDLRAPGTQGLTAAQMAEADASGNLFETVHQRKDGSTFPVEVSSRGATIGGARTLVSVVRDITDRKRSEEALRESEALYRSLFDNMLNGFAYCKMLYENGRPADFVYLDVNGAFGLLTGLENVIGKKVSEVIPGITESDPELFEIYGRVALAGAPERFETYVRALDMWFAISVYSPRKEHFVAVFEVITERRKAEEALRESEGRFRSLFENMLEGVALHEMIYDGNGVSTDYRIISTNPAFEKHTGLKPEQIEGKLAGSVYGTGVPPYLEIYAEVVRSGQPTSFETFFPPMGRDFYISVTSAAPDRFVTVFEDITDRKRAEEAVRESEARFRLLSGTASRLLASQDPQGIVNQLCRRVMEHLDCHVFFNFLVDEQAGRLHLNACAGIPEEKIQKIEWLDYGVAVCGCAARDIVRIVAEDIFHTPNVRTELVKSFGIQAYACHPLMADGRLIGTLSFGTKTRNRFSPDDLALMKTVADQVAIAMERIRLIGALQRSRDELEERVKERTAALARVNEELRIHATLLEQSNRDLDDFAHVASHDLQEPLRKIQTFGAMLADAAQGGLDEKARDYLERMQRSANRMQALVRDLLKYARLTSKPEPWTRFSLREPLDDAVQDLAVLLSETAGRVEIGDLPEIEGNRVLIRQLFQNLIGNGLKYRGEAEPVVRVYSQPSPSSAFWEIHVEDNGIGFDEGYLEKIFKPFERLHGRSALYEGTGMGLAICRRIAERHRGSITARSKLGEGSVFIVKLPKKHLKLERAR
jgi:PAS domain S-box-containing protein